MKKTLAAAAVAVAGLGAGAAHALPVTFDFTNGPNGWYFPSYSETMGGLTATVTAGGYAFDTIVSTTGRRVTQSSNGLGVDCVLTPSFCDDQIDGLTDLLTLSFGSLVNFVSVTFGRVDSEDDFDMFVDGILEISDQTILGNNPFSLAGFTGQSISFGADASNDAFRIASITVSVVPLPGSLPLLLAVCALAGVGVMRQRRSA